MTQTTLKPIRFEDAVWEGHLTSRAEPQINVIYLGEPVPEVEVKPNADGWSVRIPVPHALLSEGVHCITIFDAATDERLGDFTIIAGAPAADDLRAEIALLRAELDMLKRAFRRSKTEQDTP